MIVALTGQKGGVGKTTLAVSIAVEWHRQGCRVLLVDADPQGSTRTWGDVATEQGHSVPTVVALSGAFHRPDQLPALATAYDHVVIDCPPRIAEAQRAALVVADLALLPCGPSAVDAWAMVESLDLVQRVRELRPELQAAVLVNRKVARTSVATAAREALANCGLPVLTTELGQRVTYSEALAAGLGPSTYDPKSEAAREVRRLVKELEKHG